MRAPAGGALLGAARLAVLVAALRRAEGETRTARVPAATPPERLKPPLGLPQAPSRRR